MASGRVPTAQTIFFRVSKIALHRGYGSLITHRLRPPGGRPDSGISVIVQSMPLASAKWKRIRCRAEDVARIRGCSIRAGFEHDREFAELRAVGDLQKLEVDETGIQ